MQSQSDPLMPPLRRQRGASAPSPPPQLRLGKVCQFIKYIKTTALSLVNLWTIDRTIRLEQPVYNIIIDFFKTWNWSKSLPALLQEIFSFVCLFANKSNFYCLLYQALSQTHTYTHTHPHTHTHTN